MGKKDKGEIAYKVVEKGTRNGTNWTLFKNSRNFSRLNRELYMRFKRKHKEWFPRYKKGSIVEMAEGSVGILTFCDKYAACQFMWLEGLNSDTVKIIRVRGIGKMPTPSFIISGVGSDIERIIINPKEADLIGDLRRTPPGVACYKKVEVLE